MDLLLAVTESDMEALALPQESTALKELLAEGQAREAKLREALTKIANNTIHWYASIQDAKEALAMPTDDTALQEVIMQARQSKSEEPKLQPPHEQEWLTGCPECGIPDGCDCYGEITINELEEEVDNLKLELAAIQAREVKLRDALNNCYGTDIDGVEYISYQTIEDGLALPQDDTALKEAIMQAKRKVLMEALTCTTEEIRRMAEELK